jgi:drug/metabolite transporter (DMT)-like permease
MSTPRHPAATQGLLLTLAAVLIWGAQHPISKNAMAHVDGYTLTALRYGIACVVFALVLWWREGLSAFRYGAQWRLAALAGAFGMGGSALFVFNGIKLSTPEIAVIILALQPAMSALIEWAMFRKRPPTFTLVCMLFAFFGIVLVVTRGGQSVAVLLERNRDELLGELFVLIGALAWVGYTQMTARLQNWSPWRATTLTCLPALAIILVVWLVAASFGELQFPAQSVLPTIAWQTAYLSLAGVVIAMALWNAGTQKISSLDALLFLSLMPVVTFAYRAFEGARFSTSELLGAVLVVSALVANNVISRLKHIDPPNLP